MNILHTSAMLGTRMCRQRNIQKSLLGQRALITGANTGTGEAIAESLAAAGANVVISYFAEPDKAQALAKYLLDVYSVDAVAIHADISEETQLLSLFNAIDKHFGGLDIMVNNAELQKHTALVDMSLQDWEDVMRVNLTGQFLCSREAARRFIKQGVNTNISTAAGKIICVSSVHDIIPWVGHANYAASKGGVMMLMKTMAQELAVYKIRVNSVSPGVIKTPINHAAWSTPEKEAELLELIPYGRIGVPSDIGRAVVWLASDDADYITGATLYVDGGMALYHGIK